MSRVRHLRAGDVPRPAAARRSTPMRPRAASCTSLTRQRATGTPRSCRSSARATGPGRPPTWTSSRRKEVFPTGEKCHVNYVVLDGIGGNLWEKAVAEILEIDVACRGVREERPPRLHDPLRAWRAAATSTSPTSLSGSSRAMTDDPVRTLIVEVSGSSRRPEPTKEKADTARGPVVPAVNNHGGFGRWGYAEMTQPQDVPRRPGHRHRGAVRRTRRSSPAKELSCNAAA